MHIRNTFAFGIFSILLVGLVYFAKAQATADWIAVSAPQEAIPPNIVSHANKPMMMLVSSKDHTLFAPIYTDYEDVDGDGILDTTFKPKFKYYGYFDSVKCYAYRNNRFESVVLATPRSDGAYACPATDKLWSGNFLNWATMSRVDVIRKMLYGGKRSTDGYADGANQVSTTVLERVNLSFDSHSYVKHYYGQDVRDFTPFTTADLVKTTGSNKNQYAGLTLCNRSSEMSAFGTPHIRLAKGNYSMWSTINGDVCRWEEELHTISVDANGVAKTEKNLGTFGPKLARYFLAPNKGNGGIAHESELPTHAIDGISYPGAQGDLIARVQVCVPGLVGEERCQAFPADSDKNLKPYGIFQEFGLGNSSSSIARAEFGLITGSYDQNLKSGILRKNIGDFSDEINPNTGVFCHSSNAGCSSTLEDGRKTAVGAIKTFDQWALFQRNFVEYDKSGVRLPHEMVNGQLTLWGNPMGGMLVQALNYYAGLPSTNPTKLDEENFFKVPVANWQDPLSTQNTARTKQFGNPICRPLYTLALSSSALSFDADAGSDFQKLPNLQYTNLSAYVDALGTQEGITGTDRSVGSVAGANTYGNTCSKKRVNKLSDVSGICPEAPAVGGTYQIAGASWYGNTSRIRNLSSLGKLPTDFYTIKDALKVKTMAASLAGGVPRVEVPIPNQPGKYIYITPEAVFNAEKKMMPGGMLSFKSVNAGPLIDNTTRQVIGNYGSFIVSFNDKLFGGDYDMDTTGFIRYEVTPSPNNASEYRIKVITDILNVGGGYASTFGFSIIGTDNDGRYLTHQHPMLFIPSDPQYGYREFGRVGVEGYMCSNAEAQPASSTQKGNRCFVSPVFNEVYNEDYPYEMNFKMVGVENVTLQDPLWYAAKYGFFDSSTKNQDGSYTHLTLPPNQAAWDSLSADGALGADGTPDGYFLARRPELLEANLRKALEVLATTSNAAPAISTTTLTENSLKYTVSFDSTSVTGQLMAHALQSNGAFSATPAWEAGSLLHTKAAKDQGDSRQIMTNDGVRGVPLRWASLSEAFQTQLTTASTNKLSAVNAQVALAYIRGDQSREASNGLRERGSNLLGPVVNSSPWLQQRPMANWGAVEGYGDFYTTHRNRKNVLWLAANDGMLHAFAADTGQELMAYVPGALANRLASAPGT